MDSEAGGGYEPGHGDNGAGGAGGHRGGGEGVGGVREECVGAGVHRAVAVQGAQVRYPIVRFGYFILRGVKGVLVQGGVLAYMQSVVQLRPAERVRTSD